MLPNRKELHRKDIGVVQMTTNEQASVHASSTRRTWVLLAVGNQVDDESAEQATLDDVTLNTQEEEIEDISEATGDEKTNEHEEEWVLEIDDNDDESSNGLMVPNAGKYPVEFEIMFWFYAALQLSNQCCCQHQYASDICVPTSVY